LNVCDREKWSNEITNWRSIDAHALVGYLIKQVP
jgi:hypothetical protein